MSWAGLLARTPTASFCQCVYDPRPGFPQYWFSGAQPSCPRIDCGKPAETPGAEYGFFPDTRYKSSFFFGCQPTFTLTGQSSAAWKMASGISAICAARAPSATIRAVRQMASRSRPATSKALKSPSSAHDPDTSPSLRRSVHRTWSAVRRKSGSFTNKILS